MPSENLSIAVAIVWSPLLLLRRRFSALLLTCPPTWGCFIARNRGGQRGVWSPGRGRGVRGELKLVIREMDSLLVGQVCPLIHAVGNSYTMYVGISEDYWENYDTYKIFKKLTSNFCGTTKHIVEDLKPRPLGTCSTSRPLLLFLRFVSSMHPQPLISALVPRAEVLRRCYRIRSFTLRVNST